jgi:hypothetical protein
MESMEVLPLEDKSALADFERLSPIEMIRWGAAMCLKNGDMTQNQYNALITKLLKLTTENAAEAAYSAAIDVVAKRYSFVKVDTLESAPSLHVWYKDNQRDDVYRPLSDDRITSIMTEAYKRNNLGRLANKISTAVQTLKNEINAHVGQVSDRVIRVSKDLYYDTKNGLMYNSVNHMAAGGDGPDGEAICFRSLFESANQNIDANIDNVFFDRAEVCAWEHFYEHIGHIPDPDSLPELLEAYLEDEQSEFSKDYGDNRARYLVDAGVVRAHIDEYLKPLKFVWETADHNIDRYNDLIKTLMLEFQYVKIGYIFYFIGEKVNGKTSFQLCRRYMLGEKNCSQLTMPQLTSWDHSLEVAKTMSNIPTEDCDLDENTVDKDLGTIKCIATHESISLRMKNQPAGISFIPNFLNFFPRNKNPDFGGGDGLQAFAKRRIKVIHFTHDFSTAANNGHNFELETFTSRFYSAFMPILLGMARYYIGKKVTFSPDCDAFTEQIGAMIDPVSDFIARVTYWFDGIGSMKFITEQAILHFKYVGAPITKEALQSLRGKLARMDDYKARYVGRVERAAPDGFGRSTYATDANVRSRAKRLPKPNDGHDRMTILAADAKLDVLDGKSPEEYYRTTPSESVSGNSMPSVIDILDDAMFDAKEDGKELNLFIRQSEMEKLDRRLENATYDKKNNLVDKQGNLLNGLL